MSPFQTLDADIDDFILLLNYYLSKAKKPEIKKEEPKQKKDGFWDF